VDRFGHEMVGALRGLHSE